MKITLSEDQARILEMCIQFTATYRKEERETWEELSAELDKDGNPAFPKAAGNARWWEMAEHELQGVLKALDEAKEEPQ